MRHRHQKHEHAAVERTSRARKPGSFAPASALIVLMFTFGSLRAPEVVSAREQRGGASSPQVPERVVRVVEQSPRIGTKGTRVNLRVRQMPALTPVQVVIGATRSGFEGLAIAQTDIDGELQATVEVPAWSRHDQPHRFIVFNLYFSTVLAESGIFHVTDSEGRVVREGTIGSSGSDCATLESDDGERYRLSGATEPFDIGDRVVVEGILRESEEDCGEGLSLELVLDPPVTPHNHGG